MYHVLSDVLLIISVCIFLLGVGLFMIAGFRQCHLFRKVHKITSAEHKVIKQQIKLTDNKVVELEIRVGVLEDKVE